MTSRKFLYSRAMLPGNANAIPTRYVTWERYCYTHELCDLEAFCRHKTPHYLHTCGDATPDFLIISMSSRSVLEKPRLLSAESHSVSVEPRSVSKKPRSVSEEPRSVSEERSLQRQLQALNGYQFLSQQLMTIYRQGHCIFIKQTMPV